MITRTQLKLRSLGLRASEEKLIAIYDRLRRNNSLYSIYAGRHKLPTVSKGLVTKVSQLFSSGKLDFLRYEYQFSSSSHQLDDHFAKQRYTIVQEAEKLAPASLFTIQNIMSLSNGTRYDDIYACTLLNDYDLQVSYRNKIMTPDCQESESIPHFPQLEGYLQILYRMYYESQFPHSPIPLLREAVGLVVEGKLTADATTYAIGNNLIRYAVWKGPLNCTAYVQSLRTLIRNKSSLAKTVGEISQLIRIPLTVTEVHE